MKFIRNTILIVIISFSSIIVNAQSSNDYSPSFMDKLQWGGNVGLSFGSYTYIEVAPVLFYEVMPDFVLGAGLDFTYYNDNIYHVEGSIWSPRVFARYFIVNDIFVHAEYVQSYYKDNYNPYNQDWIWSEPGYYAGGGYRQWMGVNSYMFMMLLFNLQSDQLSFGTNPRIQIGFAAGF